MVSRLEAITDITKVANTLKDLGFDVVTQDKKIVFTFKKSVTLDAFKTAIKSAKEANKFTNQIKVIYGTTSISI